jgi:hypothetical protein
MNKNFRSAGIFSFNKPLTRGCISLLTTLLFSCSGSISEYSEINRKPHIEPDYSDITIPPNIAPLNFTISEKAEKYHVSIHPPDDNGLSITSFHQNIAIPEGKWKFLLNRSKGKDILIDIFIRKQGRWAKFRTLVNHVANDSLDSYLVYRLVDPGFKSWNKMGIYQRCIENFRETPVMINDMSGGNCINCHCFPKNDSRTMLLHMRGKFPGTYFYRNGEITKVNTKTGQTISAGVYPAWHPDGKLVAFSVNNIIQLFHAVPDKKIEVLDTLSDLILYDTERNVVSTSPEISSKERFETFPAWSPDGHFLYFCSARSQARQNYNQTKYDLLRIAFNTGTYQFGKVDTIVSSSNTGLSVSFPRISPDGKYLLFCMSSYGNFTIWHSDSDLYLMNLETGELTRPDINSDLTESYHSWSSNGRWIVFSSRRIDGLFTRPYFSYFDPSGKASKPFLLPQKSPDFYKTFLKSYNIPELVTTRVDLEPGKFLRSIKSDPVNATFEKIRTDK